MLCAISAVSQSRNSKPGSVVAGGISVMMFLAGGSSVGVAVVAVVVFVVASVAVAVIVAAVPTTSAAAEASSAWSRGRFRGRPMGFWGE